MQDLEARRNSTGPLLAGVLTEEIAQFCQSGVSVALAARLSDGRPIVGLALACRIGSGGDIVIFFRKPANRALMEAIDAGSALAATFSEPRTHRSIQIKGASARVVDQMPGDRELTAHQSRIFRDELIHVNYPFRFSSYYCAYSDDEVGAIEFVPKSVFVQTPGPGAGSLLDS
jgi:hypothetical protein